MRNTLIKKALGPIIFFFTFTVGIFINALPIFDKTSQEVSPVKIVSKIETVETNKTLSSFQFPNDPRELMGLINNENRDFLILDLWEHLSISPEMRLLEPPFRKSDNEVQKFLTCSSCVAEITEVNLDDDAEKEILLSISSASGHGDFRLIAFDKVEGEWKTVGYTDNDVNKYYPPLIRMVSFGKNKFLVLECMGGSGSGMRLSFERWYQMINGEFIEILAFPKESYNTSVSGEPITTSTASVTAFSNESGKEQFTLDFNIDLSVHFPNCEENRKNKENLTSVLKDKKRGVYTRNEFGKFVLNNSNSTISVEEISKVYTASALTPDDLYNFYPNKTERILKEKSGCRMTWMKYWMKSIDKVKQVP